MRHSGWVAAAALSAALLSGPLDAGAQVAAAPVDGHTMTAPVTTVSAPVTIAFAVPRGDASGQWNDMRFHAPVVRVGQDYTLRAGESAGDIRGVLANATLEGHVERDVLVILGNVHLKASAVVDGALVVVGGSATIEPGAQVGRELVVVGGSLQAPANFAPGGDFVAIGTAAVGDALHAFVPWLTRGLLWGRLIVPDLGWVWAVLGLVLLVSLVVNFLFDRPVAASAEAILERPLSVFLLGLLVVVFTVPALAILAATVIGLALVPFVLCAIVVAGLIGKAGVARAIGRTLLGGRFEESGIGSFAAFVLGTLVLVLTYMVPILGVVTWAFTSVLAIGAAAVMLRRRLRSEGRGRTRTGVPTTDAEPEFVAPSPATHTAATSPSGVSLGSEASREVNFQANALGSEASQEVDFEAKQEAGLAPAALGGTAAGEDFSRRVRGGTFPLATFLDRVAAFALDCLLVALAVQLMDLARYNGTFALLVLAYHVAFWTWKGTTLGGVVVGLRVTRVNGQNLRFADALIRGLSGVFSIAAFGIGCFWMLHDPARQMWHDKIAGTQVLKVPRELALEDATPPSP